jgi:hypothetical protein
MWPCKACNKSFAQQSSLSRHKRTHNKKRKLEIPLLMAKRPHVVGLSRPLESSLQNTVSISNNVADERSETDMTPVSDDVTLITLDTCISESKDAEIDQNNVINQVIMTSKSNVIMSEALIPHIQNEDNVGYVSTLNAQAPIFKDPDHYRHHLSDIAESFDEWCNQYRALTATTSDRGLSAPVCININRFIRRSEHEDWMAAWEDAGVFMDRLNVWIDNRDTTLLTIVSSLRYLKWYALYKYTKHRTTIDHL